MSAMTEQEARTLIERALGFSKAETCQVSAGGGRRGNIRYARNTVSTSGTTDSSSIRIESSFGTRSGGASANQFDDETLRRVVERSEELARLAPENPEWMPPLGPQQYQATRTWFEHTANVDADYRAESTRASIEAAKAASTVAAGFLDHNDSWSALGNSAGLFAWQRSTGVEFSLTARTPDGTGSGYVNRDENDVSKLDVGAESRVAVQKAVASREARALEPGKYTVILEPEAAVELIRNMMFNMDARAADEGRSFLATSGGGTRVGQKLLDESVTIISDPANADVPRSGWGGDGRPLERTVWFENGVVRNMSYSRYWAEKQGKPPVSGPANIIMSGGSESLEELIKGTQRGILVTRLWYIRTVDPQTLLYTGLTRDGTFFIENGKIAYAVKNFRFNESPVTMLNNVDALGRPVRQQGHLIPPMRLRDFTFTSLSDAV